MHLTFTIYYHQDRKKYLTYPSCSLLLEHKCLLENYDRLLTVKKIIMELARPLDSLFITHFLSPCPGLIHII